MEICGAKPPVLPGPSVAGVGNSRYFAAPDDDEGATTSARGAFEFQHFELYPIGGVLVNARRRTQSHSWTPRASGRIVRDGRGLWAAARYQGGARVYPNGLASAAVVLFATAIICAAILGVKRVGPLPGQSRVRRCPAQFAGGQAFRHGVQSGPPLEHRARRRARCLRARTFVSRYAAPPS